MLIAGMLYRACPKLLDAPQAVEVFGISGTQYVVYSSRPWDRLYIGMTSIIPLENRKYVTILVVISIAEVLSIGKHGKSYTSILLRESYRLGSKVKSRTLAVLTHVPARILEVRAIAQPDASPAELLQAGRPPRRGRTPPVAGSAQPAQEPTLSLRPDQ